MTSAGKLILIGYWDGPETDHSWPSPEGFIDQSWDPDERELVATYLSTGMVSMGCMGFSRCRLCDRQNGNLELSDGEFVWPDGLAHYVREHSVRLPERFVAHAVAMTDKLESADRDLEWWRSLRTTGSREPLAASRQNIREYWATYRDRADIERVAAKSSPSVVLDLIELYRTLSSWQRGEIDALLADHLNSDDATLRFDSMAVIQEFKIRSAVPSLVELTDRLQQEAGPQARNELVKVRSLIDELE